MDKVTRIEAVTEALVLIGIAKAEALGYTTATATQGLTALVKMKQQEARHLASVEQVLKQVCIELMQEGRQ